MSRSSRPPRRAPTWAALALLLAACGDPAARIFDLEAERGMWLLMVLDTDSTHQELFVTPTMPLDTIRGPVAEVYRDGTLIASGPPPPDTTFSRSWYCSRRYRIVTLPVRDTHCFVFDFTPEPDVEYEVVVRADDRPTARATTLVPGPFAVDSARVEGSPPGTDLVEAWWTESQAAHMYLATLRADVHLGCLLNNCEQELGGGLNYGWFEATSETHVATAAPYEVVYGAEGSWYVEVYAVDEALYRFVTSGSSDQHFPVPPAQNVQGGFGFVGSWSRSTLMVIDADSLLGD